MEWLHLRKPSGDDRSYCSGVPVPQANKVGNPLPRPHRGKHPTNQSELCLQEPDSGYPALRCLPTPAVSQDGQVCIGGGKWWKGWEGAVKKTWVWFQLWHSPAQSLPRSKCSQACHGWYSWISAPPSPAAHPPTPTVPCTTSGQVECENW